MRPKKIYLNYSEHSTREEICAHGMWSELPIGASDIINAEYTDLSQAWHSPDEKPSGENVQCLVLIGVDEYGKDQYDVLEWSDLQQGFLLHDCGWVQSGFDRWAYLRDLIAKR